MNGDGYQRASLEDLAEHLRLIARDIRSVGDIPLVRLSEDGVTSEALTTADEVFLISVQLDGWANRWHAVSGRTDS